MGLKDLDMEKEAVLRAIDTIEQAGVLNIGHHGNFSVRISGTDTFLLIGGDFDSGRKDDFVLVDLGGNLIEGTMSPRDAEIVQMHIVVYKNRPEAGSTVHVHSTWGTTLAVATWPIKCTYKPMARFNLTDGIRLAKYGPRVSDQSIQYIADALTSGPAHPGSADGAAWSPGIRGKPVGCHPVCAVGRGGGTARGTGRGHRWGQAHSPRDVRRVGTAS